MLKKNIIANTFARAWGFISVYLFIPLYLNFLGIDAYGLVGFYSALLGLLAFADMGFSATLNREMARLSAQDDSAENMGYLLRTYELIYIFISTTLSAIIWSLAPIIAKYWLRSDVLPTQEVIWAIRLMGIGIAFQMPSGLYIGGLMGLEKQINANLIQIAWGVFRGGGTVLVLWLISPTIFAFALWQLISNAVYCLFARLSLWRVITAKAPMANPQFKWLVFRNTWHYAASMASMALVSSILMQTDKLVISKLQTLEMLGYYSLAATLSSIPLILVTPIALAIFPRLTKLVAVNDRFGLIKLYNRTCEIVAVAIIPTSLTIAMFSSECIFVWTGSTLTAQKTSLVASLLVVGQMMQAITVLPYYLALAHGNVKLNLLIGIASIILITPLLIFLILKFGIEGAGLSWLIMNIFTLPLYMYYLHRRFLPGELRQWYLQGLVRPLLFALPCVLLGRWVAPLTDSRLLTLCILGVVFIISITITTCTVSELRSIFIKQILKLFWLPHKH